jgi:hypothetical protein
MGMKKDFDWLELELLNKNDHDWLRSFNYFKRGDMFARRVLQRDS